MAKRKSTVVLDRLEQQLANREWLELGHPTIADVAVFPYVVLAPDGNISLEGYPNIQAWIQRIKNLPGFSEMLGIEELKTKLAKNPRTKS